jgi:hypothetical protein
MFNIIVDPPGFAIVSVADTYGGKQINIKISNHVLDTIDWVNRYRSRLDQEQKIRDGNPAVASLYEQYQTMIKLVMDDI